jgi:hypothetical protein
MTSNNDQTLPPSIELVRSLRMAGRASEACALIRQLSKATPPDLYIGQLGIDMNYLGLFKEAEAPLRRALQDDHSLMNRYKIGVELCTVLHGSRHLHIRPARALSDLAIFSCVRSGDMYCARSFEAVTG